MKYLPHVVFGQCSEVVASTVQVTLSGFDPVMLSLQQANTTLVSVFDTIMRK
jgi:hypothetical protein